MFLYKGGKKMKNKKVDTFILVTALIELVVFIIAPLVIAWYNRYIHYDPAWPMALAFLLYFFSGPIINGIMGGMYAAKKKNPIIMLAIMIIGNLVIRFVFIKGIGLLILFFPVIMFCFIYGIVYISNSIHNKRYQHN